MFTLKLATNESFPVSSAEQARRGGDLAGQQSLSLRVEVTPAEHNLEWYLERLETPGALDAVEVTTPSGTPGLEVQGYTEVTDISMRLLVTGEKTLSVTLSKPNTETRSLLDQELDL